MTGCTLALQHECHQHCILAYKQNSWLPCTIWTRALMSIADQCQACYKHYRSTVVNVCPCCADVQFPEAMLCDLVREGQS
jgi:hypothetical protein